MKKTLLSLMAFLATTTLSADTYTKVDYINTFNQSKKILAIQPTDELIGEDSQKLKIGYGFEVNKGEDLSGGFGLYLSGDNNGEYGTGLDFQVGPGSLNFLGLKPFFAGDVGLGFRNDKGDKKNLSTSINKVTAITALDYTPYMTPSVATMEDYTTFFLVGFQLGATYDFSDKLKGSVAYVFEKKTYSVNYRLDSSVNVLNAVNFDQRSNGVLVSLKYLF